MTMTALMCLWLAAIVILARHSMNSPTRLGLSLAYAVNLSVIHLTAATLYLSDTYWYFEPELIRDGFMISAIGLCAFVVAVLFIEPSVNRFFPARAVPAQREGASRRDPAKLYLAAGAASYFLLRPLLGNIPTLGALVAVGYYVMIASFCYKLWSAWATRRYIAFRQWALWALTLPFLTVVSQGFLGYGVFALLCTASVVASFYRPRRLLLIFGLIAIYFGLSVYVTYLRDRARIREVVWGGESYGRRVSELGGATKQFEWFDPRDREHLFRIDVRLNQNNLVGSAIRYLDGTGSFAHGATLVEAIIALVPRAIWASKPVFAGSGNLVADYTGMRFAESTSVGIGQVLEFYINFGVAGVIFGFLILGTVIAAIDRRAGMAVRSGDFLRFTAFLAPGLCLLQVGGSLVEITSSAAAAIAAVQIANRMMRANPGPQVEVAPHAPAVRGA